MGVAVVSLVLLAAFTAAVSISSVSVFCHMKHFTVPAFQMYIVRIIMMVPVYSMQSFVSFHMPNGLASLGLTALRDCYEAFAIYSFFSLLVNYLGGPNVILAHFEFLGRIYHPWPWTHYLRPINVNARFFTVVKRGILQFVFVKPLLATCMSVYAWHHRATSIDDGALSPDGTHRSPESIRLRLLVTTLENLSVGTAMYSLILFYIATHQRLAPFKPLSKFICVKAVIFFSFWQSLLLSCMVQLGVFSGTHLPTVPDDPLALVPHSTSSVEAEALALKVQDALICIEMFVFSVSHIFAFSHQEFILAPTKGGGKIDAQSDGPPIITNLQKVLNVDDVFRDAHATFIKRPKRRDFALKRLGSTAGAPGAGNDGADAHLSSANSRFATDTPEEGDVSSDEDETNVLLA